MGESAPGYIRIRVVKRFDTGNAVVSEDLPHLHQATYTTVGWQPGNPGSSAQGSFSILLHPPGSEGFAAAKAIYDLLYRFMRVEFYVSHDAASLGRLVFAGIITGINKSYGTDSTYELSGVGDVGLANLSRPYPGELLSNDVTSAILKSYLGTNEMPWGDNFNPYTAGNYTSTNTPAHTSGTWTSTTDNGRAVVTTSTGSGAALLSKTGGGAGDKWHSQCVEVTGRLTPSNDTANAGVFGVGISKSTANCSDSIVAWVVAYKINGRYNLHATLAVYVAGAPNGSLTINDVLLGVEDPAGKIPLTVSLLATLGGQSTSGASATVVVNGKPVIGPYPDADDPGTVTWYPFAFFGTPSSGTANGYFTDLVQQTRFTTDGASTAAAFGNGSITAASNSVGYGVDPGPNFLEVWSRLATREGWYWRYTPNAYVVGTRTLGVVDFAADPGTDRSASVIFRRDNGSLVGLQVNNNNDPLAADTAAIGQSTLDGGGVAYSRDVSALTKYGVVQDQILSFTHSNFNSLSTAAYQVRQNKIAVDTLGAKTVTVLRTPQYADTYRELDKVTIHDPEMGINMLSCRILARTFTEGQPTETLVLDQFSEEYVG